MRSRSVWARAGRQLASAAALAGAVLASARATLDRPGPIRVGVLLSQDSAQAREAIDGFGASLKAAGVEAGTEIFELRGNPANAAVVIEKARGTEIDLVLALGSIATKALALASIQKPVIGGLVLRSADLGGASNVTGTVLEFPVETELEWIRKMVPGARRVGVLYSPQNNQDRLDAATAAAKRLGLSLVARKVESPRDIPRALESIAGEADVLWGLADPVVLTQETAQALLLFSFRNRIPFIGASQSWAKAGALYALDRDYRDIGAQCGEQAIRALQGQPASSLPTASPRKVVYSVNLKTAKHMKVELAAELVKGAHDVFE